MKISGFKKNISSIFLIIIFLLGSLEPPVNWPFLFPRTTLGLLKIFILLGGGSGLFILWLTNRKDYLIRKKKILFWPLLFMLAIVLSLIFNSPSVESLKFLPLTFIGFAVFFLTVCCFQERVLKPTMIVIYSLAIYSVCFNLLMLIVYHFMKIDSVIGIVSHIYPAGSFDSFIGDLERGRLPSFWLIESAAPVMLYLLSSGKNKIIGVFGFLMVILGVVLSNNRYQLIGFIFSISVFSLFNFKLFIKNNFNVILKYAVISMFILALTIFSSEYFFKSNVFDRFLLSDYSRDIHTLDIRYRLYDTAFRLFSRQPLFGVGWGNFSIYAPPDSKYFSDAVFNLNDVYTYSSAEPHNIFLQILSETGIFGFVIFITMLFVFIRQDVTLYRRLTGSQKIIAGALMIVFWTLIVDEQFTFFLHDSLMANVLFWYIRALLAGLFLNNTAPEDYRKVDRVLIVNNGIPDHGGVEIESRRLANELGKSAFVRILSLYQSDPRHWYFNSFIRLVVTLFHFRPDLVISHFQSVNLLTGLSLLISPFPGRLIVCEDNNPSEMIKGQKFIRIKKIIIRLIYNYTAHDVVAISPHVREDLIINFSVIPDKIQVIYPSIDLQQLHSLASAMNKSLINYQTRYIVWVGRLSREKRPEYAVRSFAKVAHDHRTAKLVIIGDGPQYINLIKIITKLKLKRSVILTGWLDNPYPYIKHARALLVCSTSEGLPHVSLEALALGTPVITTRYSGVDDLPGLSRFGTIVEMNDISEMAREIGSYLRGKKKNIKADHELEPHYWRNVYLKFKQLIYTNSFS